MLIKLYSITETGETIKRFGYECEIVDANYLLSVNQEDIVGVKESEMKPKSEGCYRFGYVDIENKSKLLELNDAQDISNSSIVKWYYEVFLSERARSSLPDIKRCYIDSDYYFKIKRSK